MNRKQLKRVITAALGLTCLMGIGVAYAAGSGVGAVADTVKGNLGQIAQLITAGAYVAGFGFAVGAIVKFKAHKENPTQIPIGQPIALLFVGAALMFAPSVFKSAGGTLYGGSGVQATISGVESF